MDEVLEYLTLKNYYFERFYKITSKFLEYAQSNRWDGLERLVDNRDRILNIVRSYDFKIARRLEEIKVSDSEVTKYQLKVKSLLAARDSIVKQILTIDLQLTARIDDLKSATIKELKQNQQTNQGLSSFTLHAEPTLKRHIPKEN